MRVMLVTGKYPPTPCGIGDHTRRLAERLSKAVHQVCVLTSERPEGDVVGDGYGDVEVLRGVRRWDFRGYEDLKRSIQQHEIDLLHIQYHVHSFDGHPMMTMAPWRLRKELGRHRPRVVVTMHELAGPITRLLPGPARRLWLLPLMLFADAVIVTNERDMGYLRKVRFLSKKLHYIPFASHIEPMAGGQVDKRAVRRRLGMGEEEVVVVRFGFVNNVRVSRLPDLLQAARRLIDKGHRVRLLLVGGECPEGRQEVLGLAEALGIAERVLMTGYCQASEVSGYLTASDLCVQLYPEGICEKRTGLLAALSHGLPIVCFRSGHVPSMFHHKENVMLVPVDDAEHLAATMEELIVSQVLRNMLRHNALKTAASFSWEAVGQKTDTLYRLLQRQV